MIISNYLNFKKIEITIYYSFFNGSYWAHDEKAFTFDDIKSSTEYILPDSEYLIEIIIKFSVKQIADSLFNFDSKYLREETKCALRASTNKEEDFYSIDKLNNKDYFRYYLYGGYITFTPYSPNELLLSIKLRKNSTFLLYNQSGFRPLFDIDNYLEIPNKVNAF